MHYLKNFHGRQTAAFFFAAALASTLTAASLEPAGIGRFQKVDNHVYRGAQPTPEGFQDLAKLGVKTVVDLRESGDRSLAEKKAVEAAGMHYVNVPMKGMHRPADTDMRKVLDLLEDTSTGPVFVHCRQGKDRTGDVIACYRIEHDHWQNKKALDEARSIGLSWFQKAIQGYVLAYQPKPLVDVSAQSLAVAAPVASPVR